MNIQECNCSKLWEDLSDDLRCRVVAHHQFVKVGDACTVDGVLTHGQVAKRQKPVLEKAGIPREILEAMQQNHPSLKP